MIPAFYLNVEKAYCNNLGSVCSVLFISEYLQVLKACFVKKHFLRLHQLFCFVNFLMQMNSTLCYIKGVYIQLKQI